MYQIDNSTAVAAIPPPTPAGATGYFTDGNPATGASATIMPAEFMNMLMMENLSILSAAGIAPVKGQYNQLALAISKIVSSGGSWDKITDKPTTLDGYGIAIATQSEAEEGAENTKSMTALRVLQSITASVKSATETLAGIAKVATQAVVNAGVDDTVIVTPKKLRFGLSYLAGANGYIAFPSWMGGLIIQWGLASLVGQAGTGLGPARNVTLPITFPNGCFNVLASMGFSTMTSVSSYAPGASIISKSVIQLQNNYTSSAGEIMYVAIGR